ncbi:dipeptidase 1 precursor [Didymella exigua CBS 183.55]|uniref:Dipeptidase n=1 Tax=Didymella exigua CBS 183.55 TaxID=1150837 RepID=A0A6A5RR37_9PLEO|nr:dipeptidase 1 precursor [Didymella exigua CBS 183.55]KAF1929800.1 dipeptidase 1 precursor [Didymella exigua CBS 183.55]
MPLKEHDDAPQRRPKRSNHAIVAALLFFVATFWFTTTAPGFTIGRHGYGHKLTVEQRAAIILKKHPLIDGHNDLMIFIRGKYKNHIYNNEFQEKFENGGLAQHVDIPRLEKGLQGGAFWSAFYVCPTGENTTDFSDERYSSIVKATLEQLDLYRRLGESYPKYFASSSNSHEAAKAFEDGRLISPAAIEGLHQIGNSVSNLRLYHQLGVRYATLTWNCHNKYADAALETKYNSDARIATPYWKGLSPAGRDLVKEMNRLGMLVDLAHVSTDTMRDVLVGREDEDWKGSLAPPIFSHSSAYAVCPHPRNVPDDILHLVKQRNSVVMINFNPDFISCVSGNSLSGLPETVPANATLNQVVRHIKHIGELIGYEHVGIGTDYDGIGATPAGLEDVSKFPDLITELLRQGISDKDAAKIAGGNVLRVWKEADAVARRLQKHTKPLEDDIKDPW